MHAECWFRKRFWAARVAKPDLLKINTSSDFNNATKLSAAEAGCASSLLKYEKKGENAKSDSFCSLKFHNFSINFKTYQTFKNIG